jgi:hypothetical protein
MGELQKIAGGTEMGDLGMRAIKEMGLDDKNFSKNFAGNILGEIKGRFSGDTKESRAAMLGFTGQMFGARTADEATKILALLERISKSGEKVNKSDEKMLNDLLKGPEEAWRNKVVEGLDKIARETAAAQAGAKNAQFNLGETSAPYFNKLTDALTAVDKSLRDLINGDQGQAQPPKAVEEENKGFGQKLLDKAADLLGFTDLPVDKFKKMTDEHRGQGVTPQDVSHFNAANGSTATQGSTGGQPQVSTPKEGKESDIQERMLREQERTNHILEKINRLPHPPRSGRDASRP